MFRSSPIVVMAFLALALGLRSPRSVSAQDSAGSAPIFGRDVAPVLVAQCLECHDANRKSGGLSMATFESLRQGGESGEAWLDSKSAESLIVKKLRGQDPPRMPRNRPPLNRETIDRIAAWIDSGAKLEPGRKAEESIESLAWSESRIQAERLGKMSPADRIAAAQAETRRIYAGVRPDSSDADSKSVRASGRFVLIGVQDPKSAEDLLKTLDQAARDSKSIFGDRIKSLDDSAPNFLVFIFERPAEFAEFCRQNGFESPEAGRNVEGRTGGSWPLLAVLAGKQVPGTTGEQKSTAAERRGNRASKRTTPADPKAAVSRSVRSLAVQALVESLFDEMPVAPAWLKTGTALSLAHDFETTGGYFENLAAEARASGPARITGDWPRRAEDFLKDRTSPSVSRPFAFALVDWLRQKWPGDFPAFARSLAAGESQLDATLGKLWKTDRATFVAAWTEALLRGTARKSRR